MRDPIILLCLIFLTLCSSQKPVVINKNLHSGLTEKIGNFSMELLYFTAQSQPQGTNLIISPITVWTVLAVIAEGASGETLKQICKALRIFPKRRAAVRKEYQNIAQWLQVNTTTVELQKFNALFVDGESFPLIDFQNAAKEYDTRMIGVNFTDSNVTSQLINAAISTVTKGRISNLVESSDLDNSNLILISALYFKGQWTVPFNASLTKPETFYDSQGNRLGQVNMMYNRHTYPFANIDSLQARVIEIPYGQYNRLSMLIMLPNTGVSLNQMFYNLANISFDVVFEELKVSVEEYADDEVDLFVPRFKIESSLTLMDSLKKMGISDLFDQRNARLPLMTRVPVHVSKIIHKAEIEVTEEGTTASAVTSAEFSNRIGITRFEANRPFCYLIIEKVTNSIAFGGFYHTPSLY
ncbi:serine protease inhibitor 77Ba-like [Vanessa atalanta]|uniref:serine protease inhibitor 77Ba-like n=1 Tax=Vanessa atalanta TaxID=42275 RepID=UPI001FCD9A0B|nr:serine protease inhibitor 77Ba-like [Vanessa atalanta]